VYCRLHLLLSDWSYKTFFLSVVPGKVDAIHNNIQVDEKYKNDVLNILVSIPYLKQKLDEALDTEGKFNKSLSDILASIFEGMNDALGGINELALVYDDEYDGGTFFVVDRKNTTVLGDTAPVINISGVKTTVSQVGISSKITNEMGSQISIAAQGTTQNISENVENILKWNSGMIDRIRVTKDVSSKSKETAKEEEDDKTERFADWLTDVIDFFQNFNSNTGYDKEELEAAKTCHKEWTVDQANKNRLIQSQPVPGLVPVELSMTLDGSRRT
jgi:acylphosphatase